MMMTTICCNLNKHIQHYIDFVFSGKIAVCNEQIQLCNYVIKCFSTEKLYVNEKQLESYLSFEKYFPFKLLAWEKFCFALHNCVYCEDGQLRWPVLFIYVGRGAGKNGYLAFEDFCLLTPVNGVKKYHIDIFAMSEDQAKQSFTDVYDVLEDNKTKMSLSFEWTKERIKNKKTGSELRFRTSNYKSKDGGRPGKVDHDEVHAYENYKLISVGTTGLGKKKRPRRTITTTDGDVRDGPLDDYKEKGRKILNGEIEDNGWLPFMCAIDCEESIKDKSKWPMVNPSLPFFSDLMHEIEMEFGDYLANPIANRDFAVKRMNFPPRMTENAVTEWENILATNKQIDESLLYGKSCVAGIDYMKTTDFLSAGLLYRINDEDIFISHTWVCKQSPDLSRIKAPLTTWEEMGLLTFVDGPEISPELPVVWLAAEAAKRDSQILMVGIDSYRYQLMSKALREILNIRDEKEYKNIKLIRPSDEMKEVPTIISRFVRHGYTLGDNPLIRWAINNSKLVTSPAGNITIGKIEAKSRKTDPFKALVAAECVADCLDNQPETDYSNPIFDVFTY